MLNQEHPLFQTLSKEIQESLIKSDIENINFLNELNEASIQLRIKMAYQWKDIKDYKPPLNTPILVRLEKEMLNSLYHTAILYRKVNFVGCRFGCDAPKITHWIEIPKFEE